MIKHKLLLTGVLMFAIVMACLPTSVYAGIYKTGKELLFGYKNMTEDEIYSQMRNVDSSELISEIIRIENELPEDDGRISILPHLVALIEKADEYTDDELITLIKDEKTGVGLDSALVSMYLDKGANSSCLLSLLDEEEISVEVKEYIVARGEFSDEELKSIFSVYDGNIVVIAMKRITARNDELALELAYPILMDETKSISDARYIASFLGIAKYCEDHYGESYADEVMERAVPVMKHLYNISTNELLKDQAIYALSRMKDYEIFTYIIESDKVDFELKVSAIERNISFMVEKVMDAKKVDEIETVIRAMELHPIVEVGTAIQIAVNEGRFDKTSELSNLLNYIEKNGVEGAYQYGKKN